MPSRSANLEPPAAPAGAAVGSAKPGVAVLLPIPLGRPLDYAGAAGLALARGDVVAVPLGRRETYGVVWGEAGGAIAPAALKPVARRLDCPPLPEALRLFVDWVARYTMSPPGAVLRMCLSVPEALEPSAPKMGYRAAGIVPARLTPARRRVLEAAAGDAPLSVAALAASAGVGEGAVRALIRTGALEALELGPEPAAAPAVPDAERPGLALGPAQAEAAMDLRQRVAAAAFSVTLLEGVTGSGKTEVYFEAIAETLRAGGQALVLLPEIALSAQWLDRFARRFGAAPVAWHSDLTPARRRQAWRAVAEGRARVVVGARSALFLPFPALDLIVVDEEHDGAYKQEEGVIYNARDMAVVRGRLTGIPVVLASATPALETLANVAEGRYRRVHLPDRHGRALLPEVMPLDLRRFTPPPGRWLAPPLVEAVAAALAAGEQAMLFLNRRGYAPLTLCGACGHRLQCPNCSAWLVDHRGAGRLQCHHCGHAAAIPAACPSCGEEGRFRPCGPGVERLAEEAAALFPDARTAIMASDTIGGPAAAAALVEAVAAHRIDLIIGTQIVAKGHHFPLLTLVGVVDADLGLEGGDLRAGERTFQLLSQVAGRAGRAEHPGRVLMQTYMPEHPVLRALASGDAAGFIAAEMRARAEAGMPPYGRLAAVIVSGEGAGEVAAAAAALGRAAPQESGIEVFGPAPAPLARLRGRHRQRLLLKGTRQSNLQKVLRRWLDAVPLSSRVRLQVDIDPYSFL